MYRINPKLKYYCIGLFNYIMLVLFTMQMMLYHLGYIEKNILFYVNTIGYATLFILSSNFQAVYYNKYFEGKNV